MAVGMGSISTSKLQIRGGVQKAKRLSSHGASNMDTDLLAELTLANGGIKQICTEDGCSRPSVARFLCLTHYRKRKRRNIPLPPKQKISYSGIKCSVSSC